MNRLPSSSSFQGVLDSIIRNYLLNELPPEGVVSGNGRHHVAEKDLGFLQASGLQTHVSPSNVQNASEVNNNNTEPAPGTSTANAAANTFISANPTDHEYIRAVYQCFEKRGVFKELQTFLRHKLVSILQDEWPNLQKPVSASKKEGPNTIVYRLVDDFLRCHKLLYTLSVLASESDVKSQSTTRVLYGKLSSKEAEDLLDEMGIKHNSRLSGQILKCYFDKENFSLLESMHYLGIWLDDSSIQLDNLQQENGGTKQGRRRGSSGESIILSSNRRGKEKATETAPLAENKGKGESEHVVGVEQRLLELERNLEREKEFKIKEAIEKYKKEEQVKLREELETRFKLQLVEKEREHFLDVQRRMNGLNAEMQQERQKWMEVKLKQEMELSEFRKQLSEMINASGDHIRKNIAMPLPNVSESREPLQSPSTAAKTCQVALDDTPVIVHKCSCKKRLSYPNNAEAIADSHQSVVDTIEQDRLAFLQYRMEQQDEEVKSLRRQLLTASQVVNSRPARREGTRNAQGESGHQAEQAGTSTSSNSVKSDDLSAFISESKARVEKLDTAVDKVDEIVQELFAKRRSPLSKELSSRLLSQAMKKNSPSLSQLYSSLHNMSIPNHASLLSPMNFPSAVPLIHQQVPEKQRTFTPTSPETSPPRPSLKYSNVFPHSSGLLMTAPMKHYPSPPPSSRSLGMRPESTKKSLPKEKTRPETPVDKIFEVAYGQSQLVKARTPEDKKELSPETMAIPRHSNNPTGIEASPEPEESLFHMAIRNEDGENKRSSSGSESARRTLEEAAIRHGALSREKILSPDGHENEKSISMSLSVSGSLKQKVTKPILKSSLKNNIFTNDSQKPISKSKVSDPVHKLPLKASNGNGMLKAERRQSTQVVKSTNISVASSSSSCSRKATPKASKMSSVHAENMGVSKHDDNDDQSSLSISVAKSLEGEDNNEDFWQL